MSDKPSLGILEAMEREKARLLEQAAAVDRDMAEMTRLAAKYNLTVVPIGASAPEVAGPSLPAPQSMSDLIRVYRTAANSAYQKLTHASRKHYDVLLGAIEDDHGSDILADISTEDLIKWRATWAADGAHASAFAKISMVRGLFGFGTEILNDDQCGRLFGQLCKLKFRAPKPRTERMTLEHVTNIRAKAREMQRPSIALGQSFQYGLGMLQKDIIGEWVPFSEPGVSEVTAGTEKWLRGARWNEIDDNLIFRHTSSWQDELEHDLKQCGIVMQELAIQFPAFGEKGTRDCLPATGPIVVSEYSQLPWRPIEFRRWWRKVADAAGVPEGVKNMDSRPRVHASDDYEAYDQQRARHLYEE